MSASEMRRFDIRVMRNVFAAEIAQELDDARFSFFGRGATVAVATTIPTGSSQVVVHDTGALAAGSTVMIGLGGGQLAVTTINSRTSITVNNGTGASIAVTAGTRLLLASDPVTIYSNAAGTSIATDLNSIATTSATGGAVWIPRPQFDQIGTVEVVLDHVSSVAKKTGSGTTLTWSHNSSGSDRLVLVGISWQDSADEETLDSVTYDGTAMTLVGSTPLSAIYSLVNPPTGSKSIVATWSGSNVKGAVGASASFTGVNQTAPLEAAVTGTGHSTSPSVNALGLPATIFSLVGVDAASSTVTLTAGSGMTQQWNDNAGSSGALTLTQGGASTRAASGGARTIGWTLSASRDWGLVAVAIRPKVQLASIDLPGGLTTSTNYVDARNYADLQSAADDVAVGGTLFIPNGDYSVPSGGLVIRKSMTIQGETGTRLISFAADEDEPVIKIAPGGLDLESVTVRDLLLQNLELPADPISGNHGLFADVPSDGSKIGFLTLERVRVINMGGDGICLNALGTNDSFFVFVTIRDVWSQRNRGRGLFASYANMINCYGSYFSDNNLDGVRADFSEIAFYSCGFENNCLGDERLDVTFNGQVYLRACTMSRLDNCHFERFTDDTDHPFNKRGLMIENGACCIVSGCRFVNAEEDDSGDDRGIACTYGGGFETPVPGVLAACLMPNRFENVQTAIEVDAGAGLAQDCVVFP